MISLTDVNQAVSYEPTIVCGDCGNYAKNHASDTEPKAHKYVCSRDRYEVGDRYALRISNDSTIVHDDEIIETIDNSMNFDTLQGMELLSLNGPDPWANYDRWETNPEVPDGYEGRYDDKDSEWYEKNGRWYTRPKTETITPLLNENRSKPTFSEPLANAYVEGQSGYLIAEFFSPLLCEKYAFKVLNAYRDKAGTQRVGSIALTHNTDETITAHCVKCNSVMTIDLLNPDLTRDDMMGFTMSVIRHGNNHAAAWLRNRSDWYKIHEPHCDLNECDITSAGCNNTVSEAALIQLKEHFEHVA